MADQPKEERGITAIAVSGFKSLRDRSEIEIRNLTVLAGANSSGKSSIMQPLLMLKQTLEAPYDPGALKLDGPNIKFTLVSQFLRKKQRSFEDLIVTISLSEGDQLKVSFHKPYQKREIEIGQIIYSNIHNDKLGAVLSPNMSHQAIRRQVPLRIEKVFQQFASRFKKDEYFQDLKWQVVRNRFMLNSNFPVCKTVII